MGYFIMLVIMTYSGPLFICTVAGMMLGHAIFNAQDALMRWWVEKKLSSAHGNELADTSGTGCCGTEELENGKETTVPDATENTKLKSSVGDGATPCCQYGI